MRNREASLHELDWFMSEGTSAFERSPFGYALDRAYMYFQPYVPPAKRPELTARPIGKREASEAVEPDHKTQVKHGDISRRLAWLGTRSPLLRCVLERWHGNEGAKWAHHERGRSVSLFVLTEAGSALIERARAIAVANGSVLDLSDAERLRVELQLDQVNGRDKVRRKLIVRAMREAHVLYGRACRAWREGVMEP